MYVAVALVVAFLIVSFVQSTVQRRRGQFAPAGFSDAEKD
jgi:hypothetical protein